MPDNKGKKLADLMYGQPDDADKPAFGVFPQMKPRRSKQDPEAAKDVPRQLLRGWAAGTLGLPGDIEGLVRMLPGLDETPRLPTSEFYLDYLPGKAQSPAGEAAAGMGTLFGGVGSTKVARGALETGKAAGKAGRAALETVGTGPSPGGLAAQRGVIKMPGGNWLSGNVERAVEPLKSRAAPANLGEMENRVALNKWINSNLTNYIKKQMATPDDPVRKLAEEGVVHIAPEQVGINRYRAPDFREKRGMPQLGQSEAARAWEDASDAAIAAQSVGERRELAKEGVYSHLYEPWMGKLSPNEMVYAPMQGHLSEGLGFDHIIDVLREDLAAGRIRPEQLNKVSMEQAVRRTYEYDQEMAKKMAEAQIKATEGMPVYKEYPEGYRWIELKKPTREAPEGFVKDPVSGYYDHPDGRVLDLELEGRKALEDALKYEGETMGHCVGGYCPDVIEGRSRIFSLRDAKGEPHVTVEVQPNQYAPRWENVKQYMDQAREQVMKDRAANGLPPTDQYPNEIDRVVEALAVQMAQKNSPPNIVQIKGKQNRAPKEEYLPYVQDFVKSGQWSDVGDLRNTGLYRADPEELGMFIPEDPRLRNLPGRRTEDLIKAKEAGLFGDQKYLTRQEWEDILRRQIESESGPLPPLEGMKRGGAVRFTDNPDAMRLELEKPAIKPISKAAGGAITADDLIIEERPL